MGRMLWLLLLCLGLVSASALGRSDVQRVLTVPCKGTVGEQITAAGLADAFRRAGRQKVERVILEVDSPGGYVYEADALIAVLRDHSEAFDVVAVVDGEALSAATVLLAGADAWFVTAGSNVGAAVAFAEDRSTGSVDVDAKFNGVWSSSLAGLADENGWSGDLFRAMVERGVTLYAGWAVDAETPVFSRTWPEGMDRVKRIDTEDTVLALNAGELVDLGLARVLDDTSLDGVAEAMDWGDVRTAGRYGVTSMTRAGRERERITEAIGGLHEELEWHMQRGREHDPRVQRLYFDRDTMMLTPASQRLWAQKARESIGHWTAAERVLGQMAKLDQRAERAGALHLRVDRESADGLFQVVSENAAYLRANQRRTHYQLDP
ncbi:MAG: hypothetical protein AAF297_10030 [Planctomycetota bacterium]